MEMNQNVQVLADLLHGKLCTDQSPVSGCTAYGQAGSRHRQYYGERARAIMDGLEPAIGAGNVLLAARVITGEVA